MARKQVQPAVTAKMYSHFAVITLLVTGALAMATDERGASDFNSELQNRQDSVAIKGQQLKQKAEPEVVRRMADANEFQASASGWAADSSLGFGDTGSGGGSSILPADLQIGTITSGLLRQVGLTPEEFEALSSQEQESILAQIHGPDDASPEQVRQEQAVSAAASLARSGGGGMTGSCADC